MASTQTKLRIAASVLFATGFWDALAGRFIWRPGAASNRGSAAPSPATSAISWRDMAGALHIHSNYSDGLGDVPTVMQAACAAGVDWLLLTDHNTQKPLRDGWERRYEEKPLLLIGTEVTVKGGAFLLALDMPAEWEPEKGKVPQTVIDDINAHGGIPLVSLPFDVKHPWQDWDAEGCEGLEVLNLSTIARRHINLLSVAWLLPIYQFRGALATLAALITRPDQAIARWDSLTQNGAKPQIGIGSLDAHAQMKIGSKKYPIPSYEDSYRATMTHAFIPEAAAQAGGDTARRALYESIRAGRCYFSYDVLGNPKGFSFAGRRDDSGARVEMGEQVSEIGDGVILTAQAAAPGALLQLYRNGQVVAASSSGSLVYRAAEPGAYRIEAYRYAFRLGPLYIGTRPWIFSNPIYLTDSAV